MQLCVLCVCASMLLLLWPETLVHVQHKHTHLRCKLWYFTIILLAAKICVMPFVLDECKIGTVHQIYRCALCAFALHCRRIHGASAAHFAARVLHYENCIVNVLIAMPKYVDSNDYERSVHIYRWYAFQCLSHGTKSWKPELKYLNDCIRMLCGYVFLMKQFHFEENKTTN